MIFSEASTRGIIVTSYVLLWVSYTFLIRVSREDDGSYEFNPLVIILMTEFCKSAVSFSLLCYQSRLSEATKQLTSNWREGRHFAIPAFIYALYNSLSYVNLKLFTPIEFKVLLNIRILLTGLTIHFLFQRPLARRKWIALFFLFVGCVLNQMGDDFSLPAASLSLFLMLFQACLSSLGGIYNELLLKKNITISLHLKNLYLYVFSVCFNFLWIAVAEPSSISSLDLFFRGFNARCIALILVGTCCGLATSFFLRYLDVILKEYANSAEIFTIAILSWAYLGVQFQATMFLSLVLVIVSVFIYNTTEDVSDSSTIPVHEKK